MKCYYWFFIALWMCFTSCNGGTEQEIENDCSSGVVLIKNSGYYELKLSTGQSLYFTKYDKDGGFDNMTFDKESVVVEVSYGTGFFVSDKGEIVSNNHVVGSTYKKEDIVETLSEVLQSFQDDCREKYSSYEKMEEELKQRILQKYYENEDFSEESSYLETIRTKKEEIAELYRSIDRINTHNSELISHNEIGIAYNDTYVTDNADFFPCVVVKTDAEHDLAIIQLKDKTTPNGKYIFKVPETDPLTSDSWIDKLSKDKNSEVYMISYNLGPQLSQTKEGIKSQFNKGSISQRTEERIMYNIPALPGSSGSPVVNKRKELVAINYSGIHNTQGFNYGIRMKYLKELIHK